MEPDRLIEQINDAMTHVGYHDKELVQFSRDRDADEEFTARHITGELSGGRRVRIELHEHLDAPADYRYSVWVFDRETDEPIGRGNGGSSWEEAIQNYQWQAVVHEK